MEVHQLHNIAKSRCLLSLGVSCVKKNLGCSSQPQKVKLLFWLARGHATTRKMGGLQTPGPRTPGLQKMVRPRTPGPADPCSLKGAMTLELTVLLATHELTSARCGNEGRRLEGPPWQPVVQESAPGAGPRQWQLETRGTSR